MSRGSKVRALILSSLCCAAIPAYASTASEMYRTKAIALLGDGLLEQARGELEKAVLADENDLHARFYRGIVYSRLGEYKMAAHDLKAVMDADLPYQNLHFELGYAEFHLERLTPAKGELEAATRQNPDFAPAQYYLGVVLYQLKQYEECLLPLRLAASQDTDFDAAASFMRGDSLVYLGRGEEAEAVLTTAIEAYPDSIYTEYSRQALLRLEQDRRKAKRATLDVIASISYDTNVGLFADDRALPAGIDEEEDWRSQLAADGRIKVWEQGEQLVTAGFRVFQSNHQELGDYDMRNFTFSGDFRTQEDNKLAGVNVKYIMTNLGGEDYRNRAVMSPYLIWDHSQRHASFFKLRITGEKYLLDSQAQRDGNVYEGQYRHYWKGEPGQHIYAGFSLMQDDAEADIYSYDGFGVDGGFQYIWSDFTLGVGLTFQQRDYDAGTPVRDDDYLKGDIRLNYLLDADWELEGTVSSISNVSTDDAYEYSRNVVNLMLRWRL